MFIPFGLATTCEQNITLLAKSRCSCIRLPGKKRRTDLVMLQNLLQTSVALLQSSNWHLPLAVFSIWLNTDNRFGYWCYLILSSKKWLRLPSFLFWASALPNLLLGFLLLWSPLVIHLLVLDIDTNLQHWRLAIFQFLSAS